MKLLCGFLLALQRVCRGLRESDVWCNGILDCRDGGIAGLLRGCRVLGFWVSCLGFGVDLGFRV